MKEGEGKSGRFLELIFFFCNIDERLGMLGELYFFFSCLYMCYGEAI